MKWTRHLSLSRWPCWRKSSSACARSSSSSVAYRALRLSCIGIVTTCTLSCSGATRFVVEGPVSYVGKRVGTFECKEGGRIAYGYTPAEMAALLGQKPVEVREVPDLVRPLDNAGGE